MRNSWGARWGQAGFVYIEAGSNVCGIGGYGVYSRVVHSSHLRPPHAHPCTLARPIPLRRLFMSISYPLASSSSSHLPPTQVAFAPNSPPAPYSPPGLPPFPPTPPHPPPPPVHPDGPVPGAAIAALEEIALLGGGDSPNPNFGPVTLGGHEGLTIAAWVRRAGGDASSHTLLHCSNGYADTIRLSFAKTRMLQAIEAHSILARLDIAANDLTPLLTSRHQSTSQ